MAVSLAMHCAGQLEFRAAPWKPDARTRKLRETSFGHGRLLCAKAASHFRSMRGRSIVGEGALAEARADKLAVNPPARHETIL
jgi:hypothetical protein